MRLDSYSLQKLVDSLPLVSHHIILVTLSEEIPRLTLFLDNGGALDFYLQPPLTCLLFRRNLAPPKHPKPVPALWAELCGLSITAALATEGSRMVKLESANKATFILVAELYGKLPKVVLLFNDAAVAAFPTKAFKANYNIPAAKALSPLPDVPRRIGWLSRLEPGQSR